MWDELADWGFAGDPVGVFYDAVGGDVAGVDYGYAGVVVMLDLL